ncbi:hypothetical protein IMZ48_35725 [Candidatus Bathyarchaeota archaeon]|nr:hypothetical protein [Candidatus Bathyarchaeota archaeon]
MSNATDASNHLADVSSLYGPGTLAGWACTVLSVFINWTFNTEVRETDTLTNDFLAMLAVPVASAGHTFFLVLDRTQVDLREYGNSTAAELAASGPAVNRRVAAIEAPLLTCAGFMLVIPYMEFMAARKYHRRRLALCLSAGLLVVLGQFPIFLCSIRSPEPGGMPAIFLCSDLLTIICAVGGPMWLLLIGSIWLHCARKPHGAKQVDPIESADGEEAIPGFACRRHWRLNRQYKCCKACRVQSQVARWAHFNEMLFSGWAVAATTALWPGITLYIVPWMIAEGHEVHFVPKSPNNVKELDQAVALLLGVVTVGCTLVELVSSELQCSSFF